MMANIISLIGRKHVSKVSKAYHYLYLRALTEAVDMLSSFGMQTLQSARIEAGWKPQRKAARQARFLFQSLLPGHDEESILTPGCPSSMICLTLVQKHRDPRP